MPPDKRHLLEHTVPEYTLINHAKVDFVNFAITHLHRHHHPGPHADAFAGPRLLYRRYSWIDFGYLHGEQYRPQGPFRAHVLAPHTVTYMTLRPLEPADADPYRMLAQVYT